MEEPKIVALCGSPWFVDIMAVCAWLIERDENAIAMSLYLSSSGGLMDQWSMIGPLHVSGV